MIAYAILFLLLAIAAGFLGFGDVLTGAAAAIASVLFLIFLVMFVVSLIRSRRPRA